MPVRTDGVGGNRGSEQLVRRRMRSGVRLSRLHFWVTFTLTCRVLCCCWVPCLVGRDHCLVRWRMHPEIVRVGVLALVGKGASAACGRITCVVANQRITMQERVPLLASALMLLGALVSQAPLHGLRTPSWGSRRYWSHTATSVSGDGYMFVVCRMSVKSVAREVKIGASQNRQR